MLVMFGERNETKTGNFREATVYYKGHENGRSFGLRDRGDNFVLVEHNGYLSPCHVGAYIGYAGEFGVHVWRGHCDLCDGNGECGCNDSI